MLAVRTVARGRPESGRARPVSAGTLSRMATAESAKWVAPTGKERSREGVSAGRERVSSPVGVRVRWQPVRSGSGRGAAGLNWKPVSAAACRGSSWRWPGGWAESSLTRDSRRLVRAARRGWSSRSRSQGAEGVAQGACRRGRRGRTRWRCGGCRPSKGRSRTQGFLGAAATADGAVAEVVAVAEVAGEVTGVEDTGHRRKQGEQWPMPPTGWVGPDAGRISVYWADIGARPVVQPEAGDGLVMGGHWTPGGPAMPGAGSGDGWWMVERWMWYALRTL